MERWQEIDKYYVLYVGTAGMLVLFIGMLVFFRAYHKRLLAQQEEKNSIELRYKDELLHSNIQATEKERARIARDLHDGVGASLSLLRMQINSLAIKNTEEVKSVIDGTIDTVRSIAYNLLPPALESFGLIAALQIFCEKVKADAAIETDFTSFDELFRFDDVIELAVYRVVQELVNNTLKYASATTLKLSLDYDGMELKVVYVDNGKGYDPVLLMRDGGLGLRNIDLRIRQVGGTVQYQTTKENYVAVNISIPINSLSHG